MANKSKPETERVVPICGSVLAPTKRKILEMANERQITPAKMVGEMIDDWFRKESEDEEITIG
jgi:hypothetical protein